jgi:hypothetical protein
MLAVVDMALCLGICAGYSERGKDGTSLEQRTALLIVTFHVVSIHFYWLVEDSAAQSTA